MAEVADLKKLRIMTYMCPTIPQGLYQIYQDYLEQMLGVDSYLMVESRWNQPPAGRDDPFTGDDVDICFMANSGYLDMVEDNPYMSLLHAAPVHTHPNNEDRKPIYFSDVIVPREKEGQYKDFKDLRGHRWALSNEQSLSGHVTILGQLKRLGADGSFFGNVNYTGSHQNSIRMVLDNMVDAAAVDSNALSFWLMEHPEYRFKLHVLTSFGPLPIYPIVVNSRLSDEHVEAITRAFLEMNRIPKYREKLAHYGVQGFKEIDETFYEKEQEIVNSSKGSNLHPVYY